MKKYLSLLIIALLVLVPNSVGLKKLPEINKTVSISQEDLSCLAKNIYYEAPAEPYLGKLAVATVTMNRVQHPRFPKTICGVVYQRNSRGCQFSWTCGPKAKFNRKIYNESLEIARDVLTNNKKVVSLENALYFHNTSIQPKWTFAKRIVQIGNHIFYSTI
jgi:spore germination cell wall hydrolase CwlJ-like protein